MLLQNFFNTGVAEAKSEPKGADEKFNSPLTSTDDSSKQEFNNALRNSIASSKNNKEIQSDSENTSSNVEVYKTDGADNKSFIQLQQQHINANTHGNQNTSVNNTQQGNSELTKILADAAKNEQKGKSLPENGIQHSITKAENKQLQDGIEAPKLTQNELKAQTEIVASQQEKQANTGQGQHKGDSPAQAKQDVVQTKAQQVNNPVEQPIIKQAETIEKSPKGQGITQAGEVTSSNKSVNEQSGTILPEIKAETKDGKGVNNIQNNQQNQLKAQDLKNQVTQPESKVTESITAKEAQLAQNITQGIAKPDMATKVRDDKKSSSKMATTGLSASNIKMDGANKSPELSQMSDIKSEQVIKKENSEARSKFSEKAFVEHKLETKPDYKRELELQKPSKSAVTTDIIKTRLSSISPTATSHLTAVAAQNTQGTILNPTPGQAFTYSGTDSVSSQSSPSVMAKDSALAVSVPRNQWNQRFAERISMLTLKGASHARIRLDPPELGPMTVRIVQQGAETQIQFTVNNPVARDLVDSGMQRLKEMLEEHGFSSVNVDVNEYRQGQAREQAGHDELDELDIEHLSQRSTETMDTTKPLESYQDSIGIIDIFA